MTRFNTGNVIPSLAQEDFYDNCLSLDQAMNSTNPTWRDRFNVEKPTIDAALKSAGFMPAGFDFVTGGTLQPGDRNKAVYNPAPNGDNNWYRWNGVFPKEIAANSQPNPKDENNWVLAHFRIGIVEKEALRRSYAEAGYNLVDGSFEAGGVIATTQEAILFESDGKAYSWGGALPKNVPSGSSPLTTGGLGPLAWTDRSAAPNYFKQNGVGAVVRSAMTKMRESLSVLDYGAVGDGSTDDTIAIQAAVDAAVAQKKSVYFPRTSLGTFGTYRISSPIMISGMTSLYGDGVNRSGIRCNNCSAFKVAAGVTMVTIEKMYISLETRYSTTPNNHKAIETLGTTASKNNWHIYRDLFIDGFEYAFRFASTWSTVINSVNTVFCLHGIYATDLSVNNFVSNCGFVGIDQPNSWGIRIGEGIRQSEGWMISDNLISNFAIGVRVVFASNSHLRGNIIDFFSQYGIILESNATGGSINWTISENYMACSSATGDSGVRLLNNFTGSAPQQRGTVVSNNQILAYSGANLGYGIRQDGTSETNNIIVGNRVKATTFDCRIQAGTRTVVANNQWKGPGYHAVVMVNYSGNEGVILAAASVLKQTNGPKSIYYSAAVPSSGTHVQGDISWNISPDAGGPPGWMCVTSGSPGTWKAMANLAV